MRGHIFIYVIVCIFNHDRDRQVISWLQNVVFVLHCRLGKTRTLKTYALSINRLINQLAGFLAACIWAVFPLGSPDKSSTFRGGT